MPLSFLRRRRPIEIFVEGNDAERRKSYMLAAKEVMVNRGFDVLTVTEDDEYAKENGLLRDMKKSRGDRPSVRAFLVLGCLRHHVLRSSYVKTKGGAYDVVLHESHPSTALRLHEADACVRDMFGLMDTLFDFITPPAITIFLREDVPKKSSKEQKMYEDIMGERVKRGGTVYDITTKKLPKEEVATRMCEAFNRSYALLRG